MEEIRIKSLKNSFLDIDSEGQVGDIIFINTDLQVVEKIEHGKIYLKGIIEHIYNNEEDKNTEYYGKIYFKFLDAVYV